MMHGTGKTFSAAREVNVKALIASHGRFVGGLLALATERLRAR